MAPFRLQPLAFSLAFGSATLLGGFACAQAADAAAPDAQAPADPVAQVIAAMNQDDNGLTIDKEAGVVSISGKVCLRQAEFLEMLACTPDTREHESLVVLDARPSTIHTALLLLGMEPGSPAQWVEAENGIDFKMLPPRGPEVRVTIAYEKDGETVEVPANEWILNQRDNEEMDSNVWVFAGSKVVDFEGRQIYVADSYGTALSLVNFGDDLLARKTLMSDQNSSHEQVWGANTEKIPAVGTEVTLKLTIPQNADDAEEAEAEGGAQDEAEPETE